MRAGFPLLRAAPLTLHIKKKASAPARQTRNVINLMLATQRTDGCLQAMLMQTSLFILPKLQVLLPVVRLPDVMNLKVGIL